jgi:hypothetical protein
MLWVFDVYVVGRVTETIHLVTPKVPLADAAEIARFGWKYKRAACKYMELRRELDADSERQSMKDRGGTNCARCGIFFMPASDKPWTHVGYCSKGCFGSANIAGEVSPSTDISSSVAGS